MKQKYKQLDHYQVRFDEEVFIDLFSGGGGTSTGIEKAILRPVFAAVNHDPDAIALHMANHPYTKHYQTSVWELDPETMKPKGAVTGIYADWDAAAYLAMALELLKPSRTVNIPDLRAMILAAIRDGTDFCTYCERQGYYCRDCIIREWEEEAKK